MNMYLKKQGTNSQVCHLLKKQQSLKELLIVFIISFLFYQSRKILNKDNIPLYNV